MGLVMQVIKMLVLPPVVLLSTVIAVMQLMADLVRYGPHALVSKKARTQPPFCLQDPALGAHGYIYLEEVRIHYVMAGPEDKPLMLLVHGFPEFWYSWRHQLKDFQNDYRVVALDQRGYGDSDKPCGVSSYSVNRLVQDLKQLVTALGYKKCVLVGHDWGGVVAWSMADQYPDLVDRLVILNCPSPAAYAALARSSISQLLKSWYVFFFQMPWVPEFYLQCRDFACLDRCFLSKDSGVCSGHMTQDDLEAYKFIFGRLGAGFTPPINYYRQSVRDDGPTPSKHGQVTMPTLILWGDRDSFLDPRLAELSSQHSVAGGATVRVIEGASHWLQMDRPDLVNSYIRKFLMRD